MSQTSYLHKLVAYVLVLLFSTSNTIQAWPPPDEGDHDRDVAEAYERLQRLANRNKQRLVTEASVRRAKVDLPTLQIIQLPLKRNDVVNTAIAARFVEGPFIEFCDYPPPVNYLNNPRTYDIKEATKNTLSWAVVSAHAGSRGGLSGSRIAHQLPQVLADRLDENEDVEKVAILACNAGAQLNGKGQMFASCRRGETSLAVEFGWRKLVRLYCDGRDPERSCRLWNKFDSDRDGKMSPEELKNYMRSPTENSRSAKLSEETKEDLDRAYRKFKTACESLKGTSSFRPLGYEAVISYGQTREGLAKNGPPVDFFNIRHKKPTIACKDKASLMRALKNRFKSEEISFPTAFDKCDDSLEELTARSQNENCHFLDPNQAPCNSPRCLEYYERLFPKGTTHCTLDKIQHIGKAECHWRSRGFDQEMVNYADPAFVSGFKLRRETPEIQKFQMESPFCGKKE